jgi:hypothetical protein
VVLGLVLVDPEDVPYVVPDVDGLLVVEVSVVVDPLFFIV